MTFRARLTLVAASAVALAVVAASLAVYFIVKDQLREPIDASLRGSAEEIGISQMHVSRLLARTLAELRRRLTEPEPAP